jgi:hypothetical protein
MKKRFLLTLVLPLLSACQTATTSGAGGYFRQIAPGSRLVLERPVTIPREAVSVKLQNGAVLRPSLWFDQYTPYCKLELYERNAQAVTIEPDTFVITRVRGGISPILTTRAPTAEHMLAAAPGLRGPLLAGMDDEGSSFLRSYAELFLDSARQPGVYRLTCAYMDDPWEVELLTIDQIRATLAGLFTLELAEGR